MLLRTFFIILDQLISETPRVNNNSGYVKTPYGCPKYLTLDTCYIRITEPLFLSEQVKQFIVKWWSWVFFAVMMSEWNNWFHFEIIFKVHWFKMRCFEGGIFISMSPSRRISECCNFLKRFQLYCVINWLWNNFGNVSHYVTV